MNKVLYAVSTAFFVYPAFGGLVLVSPDAFTGSGLGAVNTILTVQNTPSETGCVGFGDTTGSTVDGSGLCTGSSADVKTGASQTQTRTLADIGDPTADTFRIVLNSGEPAGDSIALDNLVVTFYDSWRFEGDRLR
jgi:hypothetical protein